VDDKIQIGTDFSLERKESVSRRWPDSEGADRAGREWGLASLLLGAVFALMVLPGLILVYTLGTTNFRGFHRTEERITALGGYCGGLLILGLSITGIVFGILGIVAAKKANRPIALGLAGALVNALNLLMWLGACLAWHSVAWNKL
jgi:hypothetical protein